MVRGCTYALCPDVRVYRCFSAVWGVMLRGAGCNVKCRGYQ